MSGRSDDGGGGRDQRGGAVTRIRGVVDPEDLCENPSFYIYDLIIISSRVVSLVAEWIHTFFTSINLSRQYSEATGG